MAPSCAGDRPHATARDRQQATSKCALMRYGDAGLEKQQAKMRLMRSNKAHQRKSGLLQVQVVLKTAYNQGKSLPLQISAACAAKTEQKAKADQKPAKETLTLCVCMQARSGRATATRSSKAHLASRT